MSLSIRFLQFPDFWVPPHQDNMILSCFPCRSTNKDRTFWLSKCQRLGSYNSFLFHHKWLKNFVIMILLPRYLDYRKKTYWRQQDKCSGLGDRNFSCDAILGAQASAVILKPSLTWVQPWSMDPILTNMICQRLWAWKAETHTKDYNILKGNKHHAVRDPGKCLPAFPSWERPSDSCVNQANCIFIL